MQKDCCENSKQRMVNGMSQIKFEVTKNIGEEYVFFPACAYDGNKFDFLKRDYPPMFKTDEAKINMPITITDVPRLNKNGKGKIEVTTGDVSTPCIGIYMSSLKKAIFIFTVQEINGINLGLAYENGIITLSYPAKREDIYKWPHMYKNSETYIDIDAKIPYMKFEIECKDIKQFFEFYFENRKCMNLDSSLPELTTFEEQFEIQKNKFNNMNWCENGEYYDIDTYGTWQPGWVGGAMVTYALMKKGGELEKYRSLKTLEYLFKNQAPSGLFYGLNNKKNDGFGEKGTENWVLIRKSADVLFFLFKHYKLMSNIPELFITGTKKLADAFVEIWDEYGQFGQFIDCDSGKIIVGGSTCGAIIPAALAKAAIFFNDKKYLDVARKSAEMYYKRDAINGYTTGGPGEILQCPDSESAFALLESMVTLYEIDNDKKWLDYAEYLISFCSSWVVSYNYKFPVKSEFSKLGMKTTGSIFANLQNKHSAPGICTLSGNSIYKVYVFTKNKKYLELYKDISLTIGQYMSTEKRPIYSWDVPKDAAAFDKTDITVEREKLPQGFICERVNMSDWETERCIGGVFNGSCWCETSNLLTIAEYEDIDF